VIDLSTQRFALYALLAAALFGVSAPLAKALGAHVSPVWLASLLYLGSGLALGIWRSARRAQAGNRAAGAALTRADMPWLAGSILAGGVAGPLALMWGLRHQRFVGIAAVVARRAAHHAACRAGVS
jgi:drug/metabolite transporter (DMT)-like permease